MNKTLSNELKEVMGEIKTIIRTNFVEDFVSAERVDAEALSTNIRMLVLFERLLDLGCELAERLENPNGLMMDEVTNRI